MRSIALEGIHSREDTRLTVVDSRSAAAAAELCLLSNGRVDTGRAMPLYKIFVLFARSNITLKAYFLLHQSPNILVIAGVSTSDNAS